MEDYITEKGKNHGDNKTHNTDAVLPRFSENINQAENDDFPAILTAVATNQNETRLLENSNYELTLVR